MDKQTVIEIEKYTSKILDLIADKDNMTTSDFQGCLDAIVDNIFCYGVGKGARAIK